MSVFRCIRSSKFKVRVGYALLPLLHVPRGPGWGVVVMNRGFQFERTHLTPALSPLEGGEGEAPTVGRPGASKSGRRSSTALPNPGRAKLPLCPFCCPSRCIHMVGYIT